MRFIATRQRRNVHSAIDQARWPWKESLGRPEDGQKQYPKNLTNHRSICETVFRACFRLKFFNATHSDRPVFINEDLMAYPRRTPQLLDVSRKKVRQYWELFAAAYASCDTPTFFIWWHTIFMCLSSPTYLLVVELCLFPSRLPMCFAWTALLIKRLTFFTLFGMVALQISNPRPQNWQISSSWGLESWHWYAG